MDRYILHAYVCGRSCIHQPQHLGVLTVAQVLIERPLDCRYAVVEGDDHKILVWDLYEVVVFPEVESPKPVREMEDVDQAIMATALLYDSEEK